MATLITADCINCGACEPECPNNAIFEGGSTFRVNGIEHEPLRSDYFFIVPDLCTECVGFFEQEQCAAVCPVDCCIPDPDLVESELELISRARALHADLSFGGAFPSRFRK
ncbi:MAG TPA: 4Fe-4S dicluster domain-containing protein [Candidatus Acidoferrales bacterium]|nr:4Fe-4S dicluster domain-containing protein [Candidatus Acidoferrales bacterium]